MLRIDTHCRPVGRGRPRLSATTPRHTAPTASRPRLSAPGEKSSARWRIATNADAQNTSVTATAVTGSQAGGVLVSWAEGGVVVLVTGASLGITTDTRHAEIGRVSAIYRQSHQSQGSPVNRGSPRFWGVAMPAKRQHPRLAGDPANRPPPRSEVELVAEPADG